MFKIALSMIVSPKDDSYLKKCLSSIAPYVDSIFITITDWENDKGEKVEKIAKLFNAKVSHFDWVDDFAKARNFSFKQVPKEYDYILWLDADDILRGADKLKKIIREHPSVDGFSMFYMYDFDKYNNPTVIHQKTQVIRNDGSFYWKGKIHESIFSDRKPDIKLVKDIERIHLSKGERRKEASKRNLRISQKIMDENPNDPRSKWNLARSYKAVGDNDKALEIYDKFLKESESDEERYMARLRRAECFWTKKEYRKAKDEVSFAIGMRPEYPDAYHLMGSLNLESGEPQSAVEYYLRGLNLKPPYYKIIVYNPRDYDYNPLMNLAKAYIQLHRPQLALTCLKGCGKIYPKDKSLKRLIKDMEVKSKKAEKVLKTVSKLNKIKDKAILLKEIKKLPDDFRSHPDICHLRNINFIKETSSGKDVAFYCGFTEREWNPDILKEGIGGSEEAIIYLSKLLSEKGWNITVYNNCGYKEKQYNGVTYKPFWTWNYRDKQDIVVLWRSPKALDYEINADKIIVDLHDVIPTAEFTRKRVEKLTKIFVKSKAHRDLFPEIPDEKFEIIPNGIDLSDFNNKVKKDKNLIINTSSPDRSLSALLDCFKEIKKQVPEAKLKWAYGWGVWDTVHKNNERKMKWKNDLIKRMEEMEGVENLGRISNYECNKLYQEASIYAYPTEFFEIDCISVTKAFASGCVPIITDFGALGGKLGHGEKVVHSEKNKDNWAKPYQFDFSLEDSEKRKKFIDLTVQELKNPTKTDEMIKWAKEKYNWESISNQWNKKFNE